MFLVGYPQTPEPVIPLLDWHKLTYLVLTCRKTPINQSISKSRVLHQYHCFIIVDVRMLCPHNLFQCFVCVFIIRGFVFSNMQHQTLWLGISFIFSTTIDAFSFYQTYIPNGDKVSSPCPAGGEWQGVGHQVPAGGGARNPFGQDFAANHHVSNLRRLAIKSAASTWSCFLDVCCLCCVLPLIFPSLAVWSVGLTLLLKTSEYFENL